MDLLLGTDQPQYDAASRRFSSNQDCIRIPVVPTGCKSQRSIDEPANKVRDCDTAHGQKSHHLCEDVHDYIDDCLWVAGSGCDLRVLVIFFGLSYCEYHVRAIRSVLIPALRTVPILLM